MSSSLSYFFCCNCEFNAKLSNFRQYKDPKIRVGYYFAILNTNFKTKLNVLNQSSWILHGIFLQLFFRRTFVPLPLLLSFLPSLHTLLCNLTIQIYILKPLVHRYMCHMNHSTNTNTCTLLKINQAQNLKKCILLIFFNYR